MSERLTDSCESSKIITNTTDRCIKGGVYSKNSRGHTSVKMVKETIREKDQHIGYIRPRKGVQTLFDRTTSSRGKVSQIRPGR